MDTLELDVDGIKNDDDDTRHVAITVALKPQLDILSYNAMFLVLR